MTPSAPQSLEPAQRLASLDAYRGLIMIVLAFEGFGLHATAQNFPDSSIWPIVGRHFEHTEWAGCTIWDLVLPSFMFMVGVSMPFSYARRRERGQSYPRMLGHAVWRSLVLIALGAFLFHMTVPTISGLMNVLAQIGLGYTFVFLVWDRPRWVQALLATAILLGTWAGFYFYNAANAVENSHVIWWARDPAQWAQLHLTGLDPQWHANTNLGAAVDHGLYSHVIDGGPGFRPGLGGYQILGFIPEIAVMIAGLMAGQMLQSAKRSKVGMAVTLAGCGVAGIAIGGLLHLSGVCPMIKKIFTPSFAIYSTGWCLLLLAAFFAIMDLREWRRWAWPLMVVGVNSIAAYIMYMLMRPFLAEAFRRHLGDDPFTFAGRNYAPSIEAILVGLLIWLICFWMYRQRIFVRI